MSEKNLNSVCEIERWMPTVEEFNFDIKIHILRSPAAILDFGSHVGYQ